MVRYFRYAYVVEKYFLTDLQVMFPDDNFRWSDDGQFAAGKWIKEMNKVLPYPERRITNDAKRNFSKNFRKDLLKKSIFRFTGFKSCGTNLQVYVQLFKK